MAAVPHPPASRAPSSPRSRGARRGAPSFPSPRLRGEGRGEGQSHRICVGIVTGAQGVKGAVRIKSFTEVPEDIASYGPVEDEAGGRSFELRLVGPAKGVVIAHVSGVENRDQAETMRGLHLYLPRSAFPQTKPDEYYHADLIGLEAVLEDGTPVGRIRAIHDFGAGDTLELVRPDAPPIMIPFTRAVVPVVEPAAQRLVLNPPPGLLDEGEP